MRKCVLCGAETRGEVLGDLGAFVPCCWRCYNDRVYPPSNMLGLLQRDITQALRKAAR